MTSVKCKYIIEWARKRWFFKVFYLSMCLLQPPFLNPKISKTFIFLHFKRYNNFIVYKPPFLHLNTFPPSIMQTEKRKKNFDRVKMGKLHPQDLISLETLKTSKTN